VSALNAHENKDLTNKFVSPFSPQLQISMPARFERACQQISYLTINWRARDGLEHLVSEAIYDGRMTAGHEVSDITPEIARIRRFHQSYCKDVDGSRLVFSGP